MKDEGLTLEFTTKQAAITTLVIGLLVGGFGGFTASTLTSTQGNLGTQNAEEGTGSDTGISNSQAPKETFRQISNNLDLDTETVMQCYQDSNNSEAEKDRANAVRNLGNFGTPTFFVGNKEKGFVEISGAQPLSRFEDAMKTVNQNETGNLTSLEGIELDGEPSKGDEDAPIKVVEYNEFGCPFCAEWQGIDASSRTPIDRLEIAESLESQYIDAGKVELISKDYPVPQLHPNGPKAHKAANCVYEHEQESYWEFHDALFENRDAWMAG